MAIYYKTKEEKDRFAQPHFVRFNHRFQGFRESYKINSDMSAFLFDVYKLYETLDRIDLSRDDQQIKILQGNDEMSFDGHTSPYASLPGTSYAYVSTPDSATVSITGDLDLRLRVRLTDWTPTGGNTVIAKSLLIAQVSWRFQVNGDGTLTFALSSTGASENGFTTSTAATGHTDAATYWIRVTWRASDGRVQFFTAPDSVDVPSLWTQLGLNRTAAIGAIYNGTAPIEIGSAALGFFRPLNGLVYRALILNGIDGTVAADFNPHRDWFPRVSTNVINSNTGELWTANGGASLVSNPTFTHEGSDELSARLASLKNRVFRLEQGF